MLALFREISFLRHAPLADAIGVAFVGRTWSAMGPRRNRESVILLMPHRW
jgi:hypothetical protein